MLALLATAATATVQWNASSTTLRLNSQPAVLRGVCISCLEFACSNEGVPAGCAQTLYSRDVDAITRLLLADAEPATSPSTGEYLRVVPTVRIPLTAEFYLGTRQCHPAGMDYASLVDSITNKFTAAGIVTILDLHWNLRSLSQTSMALADNSVAFWTSIAARHAANPLVFYEMYNEPFLGYYDGLDAQAVAACYANGGCEARLNDGVGSPSGHYVEGMTPMITAVRQHAPEAIVVLAGPEGWAWESTLLNEFVGQQQQLVLSLHPYMGPYQDCDPAFDKTPDGFLDKVRELQSGVGRPIILTEFGQYCCPDPLNVGTTTGECSDGAGAAGATYDGMYGGKPTGYNDAVLSVAGLHNVSWTAWAWVPGGVTVNNQPGQPSCAFPMVNDGGTNLIGYNPNSFGLGSLSSTAKCNPSVTITSDKKGANVTALFGKHYAP